MLKNEHFQDCHEMSPFVLRIKKFILVNLKCQKVEMTEKMIYDTCIIINKYYLNQTIILPKLQYQN